MINLMVNGPPTWFIVAWFLIGPFAAYIGFRNWCCYHKVNFGYFRGQDIRDAVIVTILGLLFGPLVLLFIGADRLIDYYDDNIAEKHYFQGRKWNE